MPKHGKRYKEAMKLVDREMDYSLEDAVDLLKKIATAKFDETVELHFRLGIDPRHSDQQVRGTVMLPHGLGRTVRVLVFAEGEPARAAEEAGADYIADDETVAKIQDGWFEFDAAIAVPSMMSTVGRLGRVLGPRGLMPNPKAGTVVQPDDLPRAIDELKAGRVEFRNDRTGNIHVPLGKASFDKDKLMGNAEAVINAVNALRPETIKGLYIRRAVLTSTMSPGIRVNLN